MKVNGESKYQYFKDREIMRETKIFMGNFSTGSRVQVRQAPPSLYALWNHILIFEGVIFRVFFAGKMS